MSEQQDSSSPSGVSGRLGWIVIVGGLGLSAALAVGLAVFGASEPRQEPALRVAEATPAKAETPATLYEFEMDSCAACAKMRPIVTDIESKCSHGESIVQRVDIIAPEGERLAQRYNIRSVPTFVSVDSEGRVLERLTGVQPPQKLAAIVSGLTGRACAFD